MGVSKEVIELRKKDYSLTLQEIGDKVHVSRERVHQILKREGLPTRNKYYGLEKLENTTNYLK